MKPATLISFAILFSSITLSAQNQTFGVAGMESLDPSKAHSPISAPVSNGEVGCPVSLRAQHGATGDMLKVNKSLPKGPAQLLHLTLINPDSHQIVAARFRVRGVSGHARTTQALSYANVRPDVTRTLAVQFSSAPGNTVTGDLWVPGMTAVLTIDVTSLAYADRSTQSFAPRDTCGVAPDLRMLVASQ